MIPYHHPMIPYHHTSHDLPMSTNELICKLLNHRPTGRGRPRLNSEDIPSASTLRIENRPSKIPRRQHPAAPPMNSLKRSHGDTSLIDIGFFDDKSPIKVELRELYREIGGHQKICKQPLIESMMPFKSNHIEFDYSFL